MDKTHIHTYIIFVLSAHTITNFFFFLVLLKINQGLSMDHKKANFVCVVCLFMSYSL